jgi:hypothetical protein
MDDSVKRYRVVDDRTFHDDGDGRVDQCGDIELATSDDPRYVDGINLLSYDPTSPTDVVLADDHQEHVAALEAKLAAVEAELRAWETDITAVMQREKYPPRDSRVPLRTEAVYAIESACNAGHELEDERDHARKEQQEEAKHRRREQIESTNALERLREDAEHLRAERDLACVDQAAANGDRNRLAEATRGLVNDCERVVARGRWALAYFAGEGDVSDPTACGLTVEESAVAFEKISTGSPALRFDQRMREFQIKVALQAEEAERAAVLRLLERESVLAIEPTRTTLQHITARVIAGEHRKGGE